MVVGLVVLVAALAFFIWLLGTKKISPEQEVADLKAKAGAEAAQIESDVEKEVSSLEHTASTDIKKL